MFGDFAANFVSQSDAVTWRGKIGYRPVYAMPENADEDLFSSAVVAGEVQFHTGENTSLYLNAEASYSLDDEDTNDDTPVAVGAGFLFDNPERNSQWGFGYQTVLGQEDVTIHTLLLQGRWRF